MKYYKQTENRTLQILMEVLEEEAKKKSPVDLTRTVCSLPGCFFAGRCAGKCRLF